MNIWVDKDKVWKLKYLILVLVRNNVLSPSEIDKLTTFFEANMEDIDIYIYILWQEVSLLGTVNLDVRINSYLSYL